MVTLKIAKYENQKKHNSQKYSRKYWKYIKIDVKKDKNVYGKYINTLLGP